MVFFCTALQSRPLACRATALQQAGRLSHRVSSVGSTYLGQSLRPQLAKGLQLAVSRRSKQLQPVQAAIFGVGAPEAILVGVVALLVFGPKGLAQAAKSLGSTLRAFQPTIRELTQVSAELKSTLENEIGINEIKEELRRPVTPTPAAEPAAAADAQAATPTPLSDLASDMAAKVQDTREEMARVVDPDIERKRQEAAKAAWGPAAAAPAAAAAADSGATNAAAPAAAAPAAPQLDGLSIEQLEAELQRRKAAATAAGQVPKQLRADE